MKAKRLENKKNSVNKKIEIDKPSYFDHEPLVTKFKTFINLNPTKRQAVRNMVKDMENKIQTEVFTKEVEEMSIVNRRVLNVYTLYEQLLKKNITLQLSDGGSSENNMALVGLIKTFTDFKLRTHKFKIHPASKFWVNSIYA